MGKLKLFFLKLFGFKPNVWYLKKIQTGDALICEMEPEEFDSKVARGKYDVPVIDGEAVTYLTTPAYPIIVKRKGKVPKDYFK